MATVPINDVAPRNEYVATAGQTVFPYTFWIEAESDLKVFQNGTLLTLTTHYTIDVTQDTDGGNVTFVSGATLNDSIVVVRDSIVDRITEFSTSGSFTAAAINLELSRIIAMIQELVEDAKRTVRLEQFSTIDGDNLTLPTPADDRALVWDGTNGTLKNSTNSVDEVVTTAQASATAAATSASNAATSESNAATSASNAATSEANAGNSETAAAASAVAAASAAAEGLYQNVVSNDFSDSPIVPLLSEEGTLYRIDTSGGNVVVNLSTLATYGEDMKFAFVKTTGDANTITVNRGGSDTIDGGTSITISDQYVVTNVIGDSGSGSWLSALGNVAVSDNSLTLAKLQQISNNRILGNDSGGAGNVEELTGAEVAAIIGTASETAEGVVERATQTEVNTGTDTDRFVSPATLAGRTATETRAGVIEIATQAEVDAGTDTTRAVTPATLPGSGLVLLETQTADGTGNSLEFTGLTSEYDDYVFMINGIRPTTDGVNFRVRTSTDGGSSYDLGAGDYSYGSVGVNISGGSALTVPASTGDNGVTLNGSQAEGTIGNGANEGIDGELTIFNPANAARWTRMSWDVVYGNQSGNTVGIKGSGNREATSDVDAVQFIVNSGNITSGEIKMYGYRA